MNGRRVSATASRPAGLQDPLRGFGITGACEEYRTHHLADVPDRRRLSLVVGPLLGRCQRSDDTLKSDGELGPNRQRFARQVPAAVGIGQPWPGFCR